MLSGGLTRVLQALADGADINAQHPTSKQTALMAASLSGNAKAVSMLLKHGADATIAEKSGVTPMHGAAFQGRAEVVRALLQAGISADGEPHPDGLLPVQRACIGKEQRHTDTVRVFLREGDADPRVLTKHSESLIDITPRKQTVKVILDAIMAENHNHRHREHIRQKEFIQNHNDPAPHRYEDLMHKEQRGEL